MFFTSWQRRLRSASPSVRRKRNSRRLPLRGATAPTPPRLESLEERTLLSSLSFSPPATYDIGGHAPCGVAVGDFNGDGNADLAAANADNNTVSVLLGNGDGTLQAAKGYDAGGSAAAIAIGDFNGDGKVDLAVGSNYHNVNVLLGNGDGSFQAARTFDSGVTRRFPWQSETSTATARATWLWRACSMEAGPAASAYCSATATVLSRLPRRTLSGRTPAPSR